MQSEQSSLDDHLRLALEAAEDETTRYHLREALQLRIARQEGCNDTLSV